MDQLSLINLPSISLGAPPYLDPKLWKMETGNKIPFRIIADAIYPLGENGEETVRKTIAPLATAQTQHHNLRILIAQVAQNLELKDK